MSVEWAAFLVSVVVVLSTALGNMIGTAINNKRVSDLKIWIAERFGAFGERLARLEAKIVDRRD